MERYQEIYSSKLVSQSDVSSPKVDILIVAVWLEPRFTITETWVHVFFLLVIEWVKGRVTPYSAISVTALASNVSPLLSAVI